MSGGDAGPVPNTTRARVEQRPHFRQSSTPVRKAWNSAGHSFSQGWGKVDVEFFAGGAALAAAAGAGAEAGAARSPFFEIGRKSAPNSCSNSAWRLSGRVTSGPP